MKREKIADQQCPLFLPDPLRELLAALSLPKGLCGLGRQRTQGQQSLPHLGGTGFPSQRRFRQDPPPPPPPPPTPTPHTPPPAPPTPPPPHPPLHPSQTPGRLREDTHPHFLPGHRGGWGQSLSQFTDERKATS